MKFKTLSAPDSEVWFLLSDDGELAVEIHSGLRIGVDTDGELVFQPDSALLLCDVIDGNVVLSAIPDSYELQESDTKARSLTIRRDANARIELFGKFLEIKSETDMPEKALSDTNRTGEMGLVREIKVVSIQRDTSIASLLRPLRVPKSAQNVATFKSPAANGLRKKQSGSEREGLTTDVLRVMESFRGLLPYLVLALLLSLSLAITILGLVQNKPEVVAQSQPVLEQRLAEITAELKATEFADAFNGGFDIEAKVRSTIALQQAYPDEPAIVLLLEPLTERLIQEARANFDRGETFTAGRLIELAAMMGVREDEVQQAITDFSRPQRILLPNFGEDTPDNNKTMDSGLPPVSTLPEDTKTADETGPALLEAPLTESTLPRTKGLPDESTSTSIKLSDNFSSRIQFEAEAKSRKTRPPAAEVAKTGRTDLKPLGTQSVKKRELRSRGALPGDMSLARAVNVDTDIDKSSPPSITAQPKLRARNYSGVNNPSNRLALKGADPPQNSVNLPQLSSTQASPKRSTQTPLALINNRAANQAETAPSALFFSLSRLGVLKRTAPRYPRSAPKGATGTVVLNFVVNEQGNVSEISIDGDPPDYFRDAALKAIRQWKFSPVLQNNQPIAVRSAVKFSFRG